MFSWIRDIMQSRKAAKARAIRKTNRYSVVSSILYLLYNEEAKTYKPVGADLIEFGEVRRLPANATVLKEHFGSHDFPAFIFERRRNRLWSLKYTFVSDDGKNIFIGTYHEPESNQIYSIWSTEFFANAAVWDRFDLIG